MQQFDCGTELVEKVRVHMRDGHLPRLCGGGDPLTDAPVPDLRIDPQCRSSASTSSSSTLARLCSSNHAASTGLRTETAIRPWPDPAIGETRRR